MSLVLLSEAFTNSTEAPDNFVLAMESGATPGIAAKKVLDLLKFKKKAGFMWVDERMIQEVNLRYRCEAAYAGLVEKQRRGEKLSAKEQLGLTVFRMKLDQPAPAWLGEPFSGKATYFKGELPKLSKKLHKALRESGLERNSKKSVSGTSAQHQPERSDLVGHEAVIEYGRIQQMKAQRRREERSRSKTRTSEFLKFVGVNSKEHKAQKTLDTGKKQINRGRPGVHRSSTC